MNPEQRNPYSADGRLRKSAAPGLWLALIVAAVALLAIVWNLLH